jgi:hypothetical protein
MRKLALVVATGALFGLAVPAFAVEVGSATQARAPVAQATVKPPVNAKGSTTARHDRGLHRGFKHSRHVGYVKAHRHAMHAMAKAKVTK